jgi:hypothetical protein
MIASIPTLLPAYGRDYKNKATILADLNGDKDFLISGINSALINREQLLMERVSSVVVRYKNQRSVTSFKLTKEGVFK